MNSHPATDRTAAVICACNPPPIWQTVAERLCRYPFTQVIVVDDGSTTPLQLQPPAGSKAPLRLLRCEPNIGLAAARNLALAQLDADWILFVDSDVLPFDSFLASLPATLQSQDVDGFGFHVTEHHRKSDWDFYRACQRDTWTARGRMEWVSGLLCAYRADALRAVNGFDPEFRTNGEDVDLGYRLTRAGKILIQIPEVCGEHHRKDSFSSFLRMHHRYAATAKRVDRSLYFPKSEEPGTSSPPLFRFRTAWPDLKVMLQVVRQRPRAFYLPPLILAAMLLGARAGRRQARPRNNEP